MSFFQGKRVLITGHGGFVGSRILQAVRQLGADAFGIDHNSASGLCNDVTDAAKVAERFASRKPQIVFHLAAQTEVLKSFRDPYGTYRTNVLGTLNVLECCRVHGVEAAVMASSDKAYGNRPGWAMPYKEISQLATEGDIYACSKRCADEIAHDYGRVFGLPLRVLRPANIYGPGQRNRTTLITGTISRILAGERPVIHKGRENTLREWLFIDDVVKAYLWAAQEAAETKIRNPNEPGAFALNVGSGQVLSVKQVVQKILFAMGMPKDGYSLVETDGPQLNDQWLDSSRLESVMSGWKPIKIDEGLTKTIEWQHAELHPLQGQRMAEAVCQ